MDLVAHTRGPLATGLRDVSAEVLQSLQKALADTIIATNKDMEFLGRELLRTLCPQPVRVELRRPVKDLFLELGLDEALLDYPWELMHDGREYYCLTHRMGRFVNSNQMTTPKAGLEWWGRAPGAPFRAPDRRP